MSQKSLFSDQEWANLRETPQAMAAAMSLAGASGFGGTVKEAFTLASALTTAQHDSNELIREVSVLDEAKAGSTGLREQLSKVRDPTPESIQTMALDSIEGSIGILSAKSVENLGPYKSWIKSIAVRVAEAAKEGGFLGIGGERVSANERAFLERIDAVLSPGQAATA
jgi:hypothetical protein